MSHKNVTLPPFFCMMNYAVGNGLDRSSVPPQGHIHRSRATEWSRPFPTGVVTYLQMKLQVSNASAVFEDYYSAVFVGAVGVFHCPDISVAHVDGVVAAHHSVCDGHVSVARADV